MYDRAVDASQQLKDKRRDEAMRFIALSESFSGAGARATTHANNIADAYLKTVTCLTVGKELRQHNQTTSSLVAQISANSASKKIEEPELYAALKPSLLIASAEQP